MDKRLPKFFSLNKKRKKEDLSREARFSKMLKKDISTQGTLS
jgi:hypothetical protein